MWEERCDKGLSLLVMDQIFRDQIGKLRISEPIEVFPESLLMRNEHIVIFFTYLCVKNKFCCFCLSKGSSCNVCGGGGGGGICNEVRPEVATVWDVCDHIIVVSDLKRADSVITTRIVSINILPYCLDHQSRLISWVWEEEVLSDKHGNRE